jgi:hypothetical protein
VIHRVISPVPNSVQARTAIQIQIQTAEGVEGGRGEVPVILDHPHPDEGESTLASLDPLHHHLDVDRLLLREGIPTLPRPRLGEGNHHHQLLDVHPRPVGSGDTLMIRLLPVVLHCPLGEMSDRPQDVYPRLGIGTGPHHPDVGGMMIHHLDLHRDVGGIVVPRQGGDSGSLSAREKRSR